MKYANMRYTFFSVLSPKSVFVFSLQSENYVIFLNFRNMQDNYMQLKRSLQVFADETDSSLVKRFE